jgi:hypothetical protein
MTGWPSRATGALRNFLDVIEASVLEAPDEEILEEARERGAPSTVAARRVRALLLDKIENAEAPAPSARRTVDGSAQAQCRGRWFDQG